MHSFIQPSFAVTVKATAGRKMRAWSPASWNLFLAGDVSAVSGLQGELGEEPRLIRTWGRHPSGYCFSPLPSLLVFSLCPTSDSGLSFPSLCFSPPLPGAPSLVKPPLFHPLACGSLS